MGEAGRAQLQVIVAELRNTPRTQWGEVRARYKMSAEDWKAALLMLKEGGKGPVAAGGRAEMGAAPVKTPLAAAGKTPTPAAGGMAAASVRGNAVSGPAAAGRVVESKDATPTVVDPNAGQHRSPPSSFFGASAPRDPVQIGPYHILETIGEGGMGVVYKAEQREPVRRMVALKIIKLGMDTADVVKRFEAERQALALMNHPNVARVYEAGATEQGRPYFAMEYVPGLPFNEYCDQNRLTTRQRLELFVQACNAIQHAHQKGIIHRDLKPSNILITVTDGAPTPKVIDFGIAKATDQRLTQHTLHTQSGAVIGTPEYMSPEQAQAGSLDIDTRSDVYSLGVVLYQLLTGCLPFDSSMLRSAGPDAMARMIRESEPRRPSTKLGDAQGTAGFSPGTSEADELAERRGSDYRSLHRELSRDLDWIVLRAMEKDRTRRYETANALKRDVERYLNDEPVEASPPSTAYRMIRFARKHRGGIQVAAALALLMVVLTTYSWIQMVESRTAEVVAKQLSDQSMMDRRKAEASEEKAKVERDNAVENEKRAIRAEATAKAERDQAVAETARANREAEVANAMRSSIAGVTGAYSSAGKYKEAEPLLKQALEAMQKSYGDENLTTCKSMNDLAWVYLQLGRDAEAEPLLKKAVEGSRKLAGEQDRGTLTYMFNLATAYSHQHRTVDAEPLFKSVLDGRTEALGEADPETLEAVLGLVAFYNGEKRYAEAAPLLEKGLATATQQLGEQSQTTLVFEDELGYTYTLMNQYGDAERLLKQAVDVARKTLGESTPATLKYAGNLFNLYVKSGNKVAAANLMSELGLAKAAAGQLSAGDRDLAQSLQMNPGNDQAWYVRAFIHAYSGNVGGYKNIRQTMLTRFGNSPDRQIADRVARTCLLVADAGADLKTPTGLSARAMGDGKQPALPGFQLTRSLLEFRLANYSGSIDWANKSRVQSGTTKSAALAADLIIAMSTYAQGQVAAAQTAIRRATEEMDQKLPRFGKDTLNEPLTDVLLSQILRREAESKVLGAPGTQPAGSAVVAAGRRGSAVGNIVARADGSYRLEGAAARVIGQTAHADTDFVTHWNDPKDYVTWNIVVPRPGSYVVTLDYSCDGSNAGSAYEILVGSSRLQRKIASTGGFGAFQAIKIGTMEIDKTGVVTVQIRPINKTRDTVMNLRTLLLRPKALALAEAVTPQPDGTIQLNASDAKVVGKLARLEDENIGYWTNPGDYVEWRFQVKTPGKFSVVIDYACFPSVAGSDYEVVVGGQRLPGKVAGTADWRDFRTVTVGTIEVDRVGVATLQVKPVKLGKGALMNLRNVFLRPAGGSGQ